MSTIPTCGNCGRRTSNRLCNTCVNHLANKITDLPWLAAQLEITVAGQGRSTRQPGRAKDHPLPLNLAAASRRQNLAHFRKIAHVVSGRNVPSIGASASALLGCLGWFRTHPRAVEAHDAILRIHDRVAAAIDRPGDDRRFAGPCVACDKDLYTPETGGDVITCDGYRQGENGCGRQYTARERHAWLAEALEDVVLPLDPVLVALPTMCGVHVSATRVRKWRQRGNLQPVAVKRDGAKVVDLYRAGDVIRLATDTSRPGPKAKATAS